MNYRQLGKTGFKVSEISFGAWAIGGTWGKVDDNESIQALHKAIELGINFIDTADVYGDGHSEKLIAKVLKEHKNDNIIVATKAGRRLNPHVKEGYTKKNISAFIDRSLGNLEVDSLDLLQLHCPPTEVYYLPEVFNFMDEIQKEGKIKHYGVSVEKVSEALKAIEYPNVKTVQIIFNMFRHKPAGEFFKEAKEKNVGIIIRVPLASGMLTGRMTESTEFESDDHRKFNIQGEAFDKGETFSGVDYKKGLLAVEELKKICPAGLTMAQFALKWILMFDAVSCTIPGAKRPSQAEQNAGASGAASLDAETMAAVRNIYEKYIKADIHSLY